MFLRRDCLSSLVLAAPAWSAPGASTDWSHYVGDPGASRFSALDQTAGGYATPCTYSAAGKQFVVIACGGANRQKTPSGDRYVAFSL